MNLAWNNCITQSDAAADKAYACDGSGNGTPFKIVFSFFTPVAMTQFVGIDATFDVITAESSLPDWWRLGVGECRDGDLGYPGSLSGIGTGTTGACRNPWIGGNTGGGFKWITGSDSGDVAPSRARVTIAFARDNEGSLNLNQQYVGGVLALDTYGDSGDDACAGCAVPICIVLNQVQLYQTIGASGGDVQTITETETRSMIKWQGGNSCPSGQQPGQPSWGSIRALYR